MAILEESSFFDGQKIVVKTLEGQMEKYDREYSGEDFAQYFSDFIGNGVYIDPSDQLKVVAGTGLTVTVKKGKAFIDGYRYRLREDTTLSLSPNTTSGTTNNIIRLTLDRNNREIKINKAEGVSSTLPRNDGTLHDLVLCEISLGVGVSAITDAMIKDRRPENKYCGFVEAVVKQVDFGSLFLQLLKQGQDTLDALKNKLGEEPAINLQQQINDLPVIRSGEAPPDNSVGKDGDIYIQLEPKQ